MKKKTVQPTFDEFWQAYPLHKARMDAERAWNRLTARDKREAIAALPAYTADCQKRGVAFKYAQGWLNGRRWTDVYDEVAVPAADPDSKPGSPQTASIQPEAAPETERRSQEEQRNCVSREDAMKDPEYWRAFNGD